MEMSIEERCIRYAKSIAKRLGCGNHWRDLLTPVYVGVKQAECKGIIDKRRYLYAYSRTIDLIRHERLDSRCKNTTKIRLWGLMERTVDERQSFDVMAYWHDTKKIRSFFCMRTRIILYLYCIEILNTSEIAGTLKLSQSRVQRYIADFLDATNEPVGDRTNRNNLSKQNS